MTTDRFRSAWLGWGLLGRGRHPGLPPCAVNTLDRYRRCARSGVVPALHLLTLWRFENANR